MKNLHIGRQGQVQPISAGLKKVEICKVLVVKVCLKLLQPLCFLRPMFWEPEGSSSSFCDTWAWLNPGLRLAWAWLWISSLIYFLWLLLLNIISASYLHQLSSCVPPLHFLQRVLMEHVLAHPLPASSSFLLLPHISLSLSPSSFIHPLRLSGGHEFTTPPITSLSLRLLFCEMLKHHFFLSWLIHLSF